jgi:hypothetical protein
LSFLALFPQAHALVWKNPYAQNASLDVYAATSPKPSAENFTVIVSSSGFNGSSGTIEIVANQGDQVTIRFVYGDGNLTYDNPHVIRIEGYNIQTDQLNKAATVQVLTFTANQVGSFQFHCMIPCFGMENLQQGVFTVTPSTQATVSTSVLTSLNVEAHAGALTLSTRLTDEYGNPIPGVFVNFMVSTDFGSMSIGHNVTASDGTVKLVYRPSSLWPMTITAHFAGGAGYLPSNATETYTVDVGRSVPTTPYISGQSPTVDLRVVGVPPLVANAIVILVLLVVVSVWSVYGFVLKEIFTIRKADKEQGGSF